MATCPHCGSTNIEIKSAGAEVDDSLFGSRDKTGISKTGMCYQCGHMWSATADEDDVDLFGTRRSTVEHRTVPGTGHQAKVVFEKERRGIDKSHVAIIIAIVSFAVILLSVLALILVYVGGKSRPGDFNMGYADNIDPIGTSSPDGEVINDGVVTPVTNEGLLIKGGLPSKYAHSTSYVFDALELHAKYAKFNKTDDWARGERYYVDYGDMVKRQFLVYFSESSGVDTVYEFLSDGKRVKVYDVSEGGVVNEVESGVSVDDVTTSNNPLSDFSFKVDGSTVILEKYNGKSSSIELCASYILDEKEYKTDLLRFQIKNSGVKTVIFGDGVTRVNPSIFNGSKVVNIFFPKSMEAVYDKTLSYLHPGDLEIVTIYYEGSRSDWGSVFQDYTTIGDAYGDGYLTGGELAGTAAADFFNGLLSSFSKEEAYNSDDFMFVFDAKASELK